jgi:predicted peroxiredoxin
MKNIGLSIILGLLILSCNQRPEHSNDHNHEMQTIANTLSDRDGVFIHITESYNHPHRVLMPLKMAAMMADDKDVIVYLDINSVELLKKGARDLNFEDANFESFQTYLKELGDKKVGVYACPTCLTIAGLKPEELMDGVQIAQKDKFFDFTKGRIITLNY